MSSFQGVLIRGVPAVLFVEVSSFQGVLIRGVPAVLFIEVSSFQGVLIRGVPAVLFVEVSSFQGVLIRGVPPTNTYTVLLTFSEEEFLELFVLIEHGTLWYGRTEVWNILTPGHGHSGGV